MSLYDTSALYRQNMSERQQDLLTEHFRQVFEGYEVSTIHDCSIGAGGTTLPLAKLGYRVSGSDLSHNLLAKARDNFADAGFAIELVRADFTRLDRSLQGEFDCIMSTGNSLPHVDRKGVEQFVAAVSARLRCGGLLYVDMRNWDRILAERPVFTARDPLVMTAEEHVSLYHVWNWHDDDSVDFVFVTCSDRAGRHEKATFTYAPTYYPLRYSDYDRILNEHGFAVRRCFDLDALWLPRHEAGEKCGDFAADFPRIGWYAVLAQKTG